MLTYTKKEIDALQEFAGIGIGRAANSLNSMLQSHVDLKPTNISVFSAKNIEEDISSREMINYSIVEMDYSGNISGTTCMLISKDDSLKMVKLLVGEIPSADEDELDAIRMGTLSEIGNIVLNSFLGMMSNILGMELSYSIPRYVENTIASMYETILKDSIDERAVIKINSSFLVKDLSINGSIIIFLSVDTFLKLNKLINNYLKGIQ